MERKYEFKVTSQKQNDFATVIKMENAFYKTTIWYADDEPLEEAVHNKHVNTANLSISIATNYHLPQLIAGQYPHIGITLANEDLITDEISYRTELNALDIAFHSMQAFNAKMNQILEIE